MKIPNIGFRYLVINTKSVQVVAWRDDTFSESFCTNRLDMAIMLKPLSAKSSPRLEPRTNATAPDGRLCLLASITGWQKPNHLLPSALS